MIGSGTDYKVNNDQRRELNKLLSTKSALELQSSHVQMFNKAKWNGSILYTQGYKRVSKRNSYTVSYSPLDQEITLFGIVERLISVNEQHIAILKNLVPNSNYSPFNFTDYDITCESKSVLFSDYITFELGEHHYIFIHQIKHKCCNLSNNKWNILTIPINNVEIE